MTEQDQHVVEQHLKQSAHFISVKFLPNFQKDHDNSLLYGQDIYKGLIVTLNPEYEITAADVMWLHPNNAQCRALFEGGVYQQCSLPDMNASAGVYQTRNINALGDEVKDTYTIVDSHLSQEWRGTLQSIYSNKYQTEILKRCKDIAEEFGAGKLVSASYTNMLFKGSGNFHYYNAAYKDQGLVLQSPLIGYTSTCGKDHPADWIDESNHLNNLNKEQLDSVYSRCDWESCRLINTYAFKKSMGNIVGKHFKPVSICLAVTPIHDKLSPKQLVEMTPRAMDIPEYKNVLDHVKENKIRIPYSQELALKLLELRDQHDILNMYDTGNITLPRHIIEQII